MAVTDIEIVQDTQLSNEDSLVHYCCASRPDYPTFCGYHKNGPLVSYPEVNCIVCIDILNSTGPFMCPITGMTCTCSD